MRSSGNQEINAEATQHRQSKLFSSCESAGCNGASKTSGVQIFSFTSFLLASLTFSSPFLSFTLNIPI